MDHKYRHQDRSDQVRRVANQSCTTQIEYERKGNVGTEGHANLPEQIDMCPHTHENDQVTGWQIGQAVD